MTSNTAPSGKSSVSSFSDNYLQYAFRAFDKTTSFWQAQSKSGWVKYEFDLPIVISKYVLQVTGIINGAPTQWTFEGSNDDTSWTVLDTKTGISDWTSGMTKEFEFQNNVNYKFYRLNVVTTKDGSERIQLAEVDMFEYVFYDKFLLQVDNERYTSKIDNISLKSSSASSVFNTYSPSLAFDGIINTASLSYWSSAVPTGWLSFTLDKAVPLKNYSLYVRSTGDLTTAPKNWTFEGSNNGVNWDILDTRKNIGDWANTGFYRKFSCEIYRSYNIYRINVSQNNGSNQYVQIVELQYEAKPYLGVIPNPTEQSFIQNGMDRDYAIDTNEEINIRQYIKQDSVILGSGKVFKQSIDTSKIPIKKANIT